MLFRISGGAFNSYSGNAGVTNETLVENCTFINCSCRNNGGAVEFFTSYSTMRNCVFINNTAKSVSSGNNGHGGGLLFTGSAYNITVYDCVFINNTGLYGGGAEASGVNSSMINCTFEGNTAKKEGGGLRFAGKDSSLYNSTFFNNTSPNGGGIYFSASNCVIFYSNFTYNEATSNGGAVMFSGSNCNLTYCNFINNIANEGGAVKFNAENGYMGFCNYTNNSATQDGGALCSNAIGSTVQNCTFTNNTAPTGKDFYAHNGKTITFIGLQFDTLYLTNNNYAYSVTDGYGTWWDRPAAWKDDYDFLDSFLYTSSGNPTI